MGDLVARALKAHEDSQRVALRHKRESYCAGLRKIKQHIHQMFDVCVGDIKINAESFGGHGYQPVATLQGLRFAVDTYYDDDLGWLPTIRLLPTIDMINAAGGGKEVSTFNAFGWRSRDIRSLEELGELLAHFEPES